MNNGLITNAMSVDVEDYFQVSAFESHIPRERWEQIPARVEANTDRILALFDSHGVKATFFVLGWIAERYPTLVRRICEEGHEVASHGFAHVRVTSQDSAQFKADVESTKKLLEDTSGAEVKGFRAASFSIGRDNLWALDILRTAQYQYSSSIYPVYHDSYGMPEAPRFAFHHEDGLLEIPITTIEMGGRKLPCGGGGYFRLFPYSLSRWAIRRVNSRDSMPAVFYFHPWEIDPDQPKQHGLKFKTRFRHYLNLKRMEQRLDRLLNDFRWDRMDRVYLEESTQSAPVG